MLETTKESLECLKINEIEVCLGKKKIMLNCSFCIRDEKKLLYRSGHAFSRWRNAGRVGCVPASNKRVSASSAALCPADLPRGMDWLWERE